MATYRVLCISGSGRTGSTLLSILLSQNADCFNLGQSRDLWKAYRKNDQCSCEQTVKNCSVWKEVIGNLVKDNPDFKVKDVQNDMRQFIDRISTLSVE